LTTTSEVENFPGFPEGVDGFQLIDNLRKQATRFGTRFRHALVESVDFSATPRILKTMDGELAARAVIIATGAAPRLTGIPGERELFGGKGVSTCATCDGAFYRGVDVDVIGGGDSACEEALFLTHFARKVYLVHRRDSLRASKIMAERVIAHEKIEMVWNSVPNAVEGVEESAIRALEVTNTIDGSVRKLPVKGIFVAIGHIPNTSPFADALDVDDNGYFVPAPGSQVRTRVPGVYVAGDCTDHTYRQAITAAGMGCQAAIEAERWLAGQHTERSPITPANTAITREDTFLRINPPPRLPAVRTRIRPARTLHPDDRTLTLLSIVALPPKRSIHSHGAGCRVQPALSVHPASSGSCH